MSTSGPSEVPLSMTRANDQVWVLKVPKFLSRYLSDERLGGKALGTVVKQEVGGSSSSSSAASARPTYELRLDAASLPEGMPRDYQVSFSTPPPATYVLSHPATAEQAVTQQQGAGKGLATSAQHEGRVIAKGEIRPSGGVDDDDYRSLMRERFEKADTKARQVGIVEDDSQLKRTALSHKDTQRDERRALKKRGEQRELQASKRPKHVTLSKKELRDRVVELFGQKAYWQKPELVKELGNAEGLKSCLDELCIKITQRGPHYGDFELKPELSGRAASSKAKSDES